MPRIKAKSTLIARPYRGTLGDRRNPPMPEPENGLVTAVLRPSKRALKFKGERVVAVVQFGPNNSKRYSNNGFGYAYRHPSILLQTINQSGERHRYTMNVSFSSQTDNDTSRANPPNNQPRGIQAMPGWHAPYGLGIDRANAEHSSDLDALTFAAELIQRARVAYQTNENKRQNDARDRRGLYPKSNEVGTLIPVMVGLRLLGVEVWVCNSMIAARRSSRMPEDLISVEDEIAQIEASGSDPYPRRNPYHA